MTRRTVPQDLTFKWAVRISGRFNADYVFQTDDDLCRWAQEDFLELKRKYGDALKFNQEQLDELKVGDACFVRGDGDEVYEIKSLIQYNKDRYGFVLNAGFAEEVAKCYSHWGPDCAIKLDEHFNRVFVCNRCKRESYNLKDIKDLFCQKCDRSYKSDNCDYDLGD